MRDIDIADANADSASLIRLERSGWLRTILEPSGPRFEIVHDRLLNWVVALSLVDALRASPENIDAIANRLKGFLSGHQSVSGRMMGFVAMDVVWLILQEEGLKSHLPALFSKFDGHPIEAEGFYGELIPTLGSSVVESLVDRLKSAIQDGYLSRIIATSIGQIGGDASVAAARQLLADEDPLLKCAAMQILTVCPSLEVLDQLWSLHVAGNSNSAPFLREHEHNSQLYKDSFGALRECCRKNPQWLNQAIQHADAESQPVHDLAYLLGAIEGEVGKALWLANKKSLFSKVCPDKQRSLASCIRYYRDTEEVPWLLGQVSREDDFVGAMAMSGTVADRT